MILNGGKETTPVTDREREFYDTEYSISELREVKEPLQIRGLPDLRGKRMLVCGCGIGVEAVRAARTGAQVYTFDISPVAVERTRQLASLNHVVVDAWVMDFHHLDYPDDFFDAAYGQYILHHVDCALAGRELFRVLKPGGLAYFMENSDGNPLIMWVRRVIFGSSGARHRRRVLFVQRTGTVDEDPLSKEEVAVLRRIFGGNVVVENTYFLFFRLFARHVWNSPASRKVTTWLDRVIPRVAPSAKRYSFSQSVWLHKTAHQSLDAPAHPFNVR